MRETDIGARLPEAPKSKKLTGKNTKAHNPTSKK